METRATIFFGIVGIGVLLLGIFLLYQPETANARIGSTPGLVNGLSTAQLGSLSDMLRENPSRGRVTFFSKSRWQDGMRSFTSFTGYKIDGQMYHNDTREFVLLGDEGPELSGSDAAPGAVEELMYAMATCMIAAGNANAALMGIELTRFEVDLEADLDLHGLFAINDNVRPGLNNLRANFTIAGDADEETLIKIAMLGYQYSPVSETVRNGISFTPQVTVAAK